MQDFIILEGTKKILISAPHVYQHRRPNLVGKYKAGEVQTDNIVKDICTKSSAFGIYTDKKLEYDPNYHKTENPYKNEVEELIKKNKIKKFLDIHGLRDCNIDIALYYKSKFSKSIKLAEEISIALNKGVLRGSNIQIFRLLDNDQETLTEFVADQLRVPAIQIEIARYIRDDKKMCNSLVENLSEYLKD